MPTSAVTVTAFTNFAITTGRAIADAAMLAETAPASNRSCLSTAKAYEYATCSLGSVVVLARIRALFTTGTDA